MCGGLLYAVELPDAGQGACCEGSAYNGPHRCTCWKPIYDLKQRKPKPGTAQVRERACVDCAYRPDSPERAGADGYACNDGELEDIVQTGEVFYCHQGIRKPIKLRHPCGVVIDGHPASYDPPIVDRVPYRADGTPANICAGWAARRASVGT
jgi:hypothetical protein